MADHCRSLERCYGESDPNVTKAWRSLACVLAQNLARWEDGQIVSDGDLSLLSVGDSGFTLGTIFHRERDWAKTLGAEIEKTCGFVPHDIENEGNYPVPGEWSCHS